MTLSNFLNLSEPQFPHCFNVAFGLMITKTSVKNLHNLERKRYSMEDRDIEADIAVFHKR